MVQMMKINVRFLFCITVSTVPLPEILQNITPSVGLTETVSLFPWASGGWNEFGLFTRIQCFYSYRNIYILKYIPGVGWEAIWIVSPSAIFSLVLSFIDNSLWSTVENIYWCNPQVSALRYHLFIFSKMTIIFSIMGWFSLKTKLKEHMILLTTGQESFHLGQKSVKPLFKA